ncbi:MAG: hypothetical protein K2J65_02800 [Duncaniella sp.]|nr:hypothetical protein [Duncaniella sp.]
MSENRLIVKNTLFLYVRMFLSMGISLYVSRIVLQQLGVEDFGIYSVVGALSLFFLFFRYGLSTAIQRFLAYQIGIKNQEGLQKYFSAGLAAIILICLIVSALGESTGTLALRYIIDIPTGREADALFVFHFSLLILVLGLLSSSFESLILAHEKMAFFAWLAVAEAVMKLVIAVSLPLIAFDKLRVYIMLLAASSLIVLICHIIYCRRNFPEVKITLRGSKERLRTIFSFAGWNTLSSFADLCYLQGSGIILNSFFGVTLNAAMGVTNQVKNAVGTFSRNIQAAANPSMVKEFARMDYQNFARITYSISKVSYLLLLWVGIPILLNTHTILSIWLTIIPPYTEIFVQLMICFCLFDNLVGPLWIAMQAAGNIRNYQITLSIVWILSLPVMYLSLRLGAPPQSIMLIQIIFSVITLSIRLWFANRYCHLPFGEYLTSVILPLMRTSIVSVIPPFTASLFITPGISALIITSLLSLVTLPLVSYFVGLSDYERNSILDIIRNKFLSRIKNSVRQG